MKAFSEELWDVLAEQHRANAVIRGQDKRRRLAATRRLVPTTAVAVAVAAAGIAALEVLSGHPQPAYGIETAPDGTVTLTVDEVTGVREANEALANRGIPVVVARFEPGCSQRGQLAAQADRENIMTMVETTRPDGDLQSLKWIVRPQLIPSGDVLGLTAHFVPSTQGRALGVGYTLYRGTAPTCVRGPS